MQPQPGPAMVDVAQMLEDVVVVVVVVVVCRGSEFGFEESEV